MGELGSGVPDQRVLCPNTGEVCPMRVNITTLFESSSDIFNGTLAFDHSSSHVVIGLPEEFDPSRDHAKTEAQLAQHARNARDFDCGSTSRDACPVPVGENKAKERETVLSGIGRALRIRRNV